MEAIVRGRHGNPFAALGMHGGQGKPVAVNVFTPQAAEVEVIGENGAVLAKLERIHREGFFSGFIPDRTDRFDYRLRLRAGDSSWDVYDPYSFPPVLGEVDEYLLGEGRHRDLYRRLGAHAMVLEGIEGVLFSVWAPNARRVSVVGDFNAWDGRRHPMRKRIGVGIWELFIPGIGLGALYKFEILGVHGDILPLKADPLSFAQETPPATASIVCGPVEHQWKDGEWMNSRGVGVATSRPISIYEVHLGSWRRGGNAELLDYETLAEMLSSYALDMGFTHVELLPVTEHPFGGSWGYQPVGLFAPTRRFGPPKGFARFVDRLHQSGIGVILDWVPAHFPSDDYGLSRFDGTALYEHEDPRLGFHRDWNTLIYNFGRLEVANFLQASALYWLDCLHADGLRVDAVASMLYLDYSRQPGEWMPNRYGGNENLDAIEFLRDTNRLIGERYPDTLMIAEESTAWAGVSRPPDQGGLGFSFKWNMGWMHDSLSYMQLDPIYRRHHHHQMTFASSYASSENFVLPLSHDEVVYGKGSLLGKMPGDRWQKFANLRAYFGFMWGHPGKKLLFMGGEFGQEREWNHDQSLDWHLLDDPMHRGVQDLVRDLNRLYREHRPLHQLDCSDAGFQWVEADDLDNSVYSFLRWSEDRREAVLVVSNMTPVVRENYRVGVPYRGSWRVLLNTDDGRYGGSHVSSSPTDAEEPGWQRQPASLRLNVPPLATLYLAPAG